MDARRSITFSGLASVAFATATASAQCVAPSTWFPHDRTPSPSMNSVPKTNCDFHQWSWQTFLWLTQTVDGDLRFISQMYSSDNLFDVEEFRKIKGPDWLSKRGGTLTVRPRDTKPVTIRGEPQINQAGDNGILIDQQGHAVYYAIHINQVYFNFIVAQQYYDPNILRRASPVVSFPVGTLEIKSSWRLVNEGEDTSTFYTTSAILEPFEETHGTVVVGKVQGKKKQTVALVGLHVAGLVEGHPEFIWATFEHRGNAPILPPRMKMNSPAPVSPSNATFYTAGSAAAACNRPNNGIVTIDPTTNQLRPITQVVREVAGGGGGDTALVQDLNDSVHELLRSDTAVNYDLIGSLWITKGALQPDTIPGDPDQQQGSIRLSNTTMETFRQSVGNCFSCHDTRNYKIKYTVEKKEEEVAFPAKDLNLSHALRRSYILNEQLLRAKAAKKVGEARKK